MTAMLSNENGMIYISQEVIAKIAGQATSESYGIVGMVSKNATSGFLELLQGSALSKGVTITLRDNMVYIDLFVIIQYGTKISVVADNVIHRVKYNVEQQTGLKVKKIDLHVKGVRVQK